VATKPYLFKIPLNQQLISIAKLGIHSYLNGTMSSQEPWPFLDIGYSTLFTSKEANLFLSNPLRRDSPTELKGFTQGVNTIYLFLP
jgi:hypothetical protein